MEVKPGYKQTEVGVIPEEWDVKRSVSSSRSERWLDGTRHSHRPSVHS